MTITTKNNHKVEIKEEITRRIERIMNKPMNKLEMTLDDGKPKMSNMNMETINELEDSKILALVENIDGKTDNILETVLDFPKADYNEVLYAINKVIGEEKKSLK